MVVLDDGTASNLYPCAHLLTLWLSFFCRSFSHCLRCSSVRLAGGVPCLCRPPFCCPLTVTPSSSGHDAEPLEWTMVVPWWLTDELPPTLPPNVKSKSTDWAWTVAGTWWKERVKGEELGGYLVE
jgi:hypothetical protein